MSLDSRNTRSRWEGRCSLFQRLMNRMFPPIDMGRMIPPFDKVVSRCGQGRIYESAARRLMQLSALFLMKLVFCRPS